MIYKKAGSVVQSIRRVIKETMFSFQGAEERVQTESKPNEVGLIRRGETAKRSEVFGWSERAYGNGAKRMPISTRFAPFAQMVLARRLCRSEPAGGGA